MIIADASVLIALAKMKKLRLLKQLYGEVLIAPVVKAEAVDAGRAISAPGVEQIEKAMDDGWIRLARLSAKEKELARSILTKSRLDEGEAESIALAGSRRLRVIIDDREARAFADVAAARFLGTAAILLQAFIDQHLTFKELEDAVAELSGTIWLAPAVVTEILKAAREAKK
ncbi:MAG: hypothetical protein HY315_06455 [Acidobacteria bacterium]|nr:hypothetical protein [Acidobacteriota bacterium]